MVSGGGTRDRGDRAAASAPPWRSTGASAAKGALPPEVSYSLRRPTEEELEKTAPRVAEQMLPVAERRRNFREVVRGLTPASACAEAGRCLRCDLGTEDVDEPDMEAMTINLNVDGRGARRAAGPDDPARSPWPTGFRIPHLCHDPRLTPTGACRLCLVEIEGEAGLHTACTRLADARHDRAHGDRRRPRVAQEHARTAPQRAPRRLHHLRQGRRLPAAGLRLRIPGVRDALPLGHDAAGPAELHHRQQGHRVRPVQVRPLPALRQDLRRGGHGRGAHAAQPRPARAGQHRLRPAR